MLGEIDGGGEEEQAVSQTRLALAVKNMWELQNFVMALDGIETVGTLTEFAQKYVFVISCDNPPPPPKWLPSIGADSMKGLSRAI